MLNRINAAAGSRRLPSSLCLDVVRKKKRKRKETKRKGKKKKKKDCTLKFRADEQYVTGFLLRKTF